MHVRFYRAHITFRTIMQCFSNTGSQPPPPPPGNCKNISRGVTNVCPELEDVLKKCFELLLHSSDRCSTFHTLGSSTWRERTGRRSHACCLPAYQPHNSIQQLTGEDRQTDREALVYLVSYVYPTFLFCSCNCSLPVTCFFLGILRAAK